MDADRRARRDGRPRPIWVVADRIDEEGVTVEVLADRPDALDRTFAGLVAKGIGIWFGAQTFINMGVNLGLLPTKGLTLPLVSYGGSGILLNCVAVAVLMRVDYENRVLMRGGKV